MIEIFIQLKSLFILILSFILAYYLHPSLLLNLPDSEKIRWGVDTAVWNTVFNILYTVGCSLVKRQQLDILCKLKNPDGSSDIMTISGKGKKVLVELSIEGKSDFVTDDLEIKILFPNWLTPQLKPEAYIFQADAQTFLVDIRKIIDSNETVKLTRTFTLDLISNVDSYNEDHIEGVILKSKCKKKYLIRYRCEKIILKREG